VSQLLGLEALEGLRQHQPGKEEDCTARHALPRRVRIEKTSSRNSICEPAEFGHRFAPMPRTLMGADLETIAFANWLLSTLSGLIRFVFCQSIGHNQQALLPSKVQLLEVSDKSGDALAFSCNAVNGFTLICVRVAGFAIGSLQVLEEIENGYIKQLGEGCELIGRDKAAAVLVFEIRLQVDSQSTRDFPVRHTKLLTPQFDARPNP